METPTVIVRAPSDALVKIYDETHDEVVYINNTNADGETAPITLPDATSHYFIDVTIF